MIDQREVRHLIRQNKKIKEKIAEQARVYKEERQKLKFINRSLQKTLEEEKAKNQSTIEEFNAQIIALEAELRRVKSNEPQVTIYTTPNSRPIKQISFAQLEAESKRLAEETNRIIQQSQKPSPSIFMSSSLNTSNNPYQTSKFSNMQNYRTRYQFNLSNNYSNSNFNNNNNNMNNNNNSLQQQQSQDQYNYSKTQQPITNQNNSNNTMSRQENQNLYQMNQEIPQKNLSVPNQQLNSNTFPLSSNQQSKELLNQIIEEEEEEIDSSQSKQKINSSNNSLSDDTIPADDNQSTVKSSASENINKSNSKIQMQSQQSLSQSSEKAQSNSINQSEQTISQNSGKSQSSSINKSQSSSSKDLINTPKPSPNKADPIQNQVEAPVSSQSQNVASNNDKNQQNQQSQKAATSPGIPVIINEDSQSLEDPFAENFLNDDVFPDEASKSIDQQQPQQQQQKEQPQKEEKEQPKPQQQQKPQPQNSPNQDPFLNNYSGMFDDISFNHDAFGSELDMQAAFDAPSQSISVTKKDDNNAKSKTNDNNKDKKSANQQKNKKDENLDDSGDLHIPSAGSWNFPSSQIQFEGIDL